MVIFYFIFTKVKVTFSDEFSSGMSQTFTSASGSLSYVDETRFAAVGGSITLLEWRENILGMLFMDYYNRYTLNKHVHSACACHVKQISCDEYH